MLTNKRRHAIIMSTTNKNFKKHLPFSSDEKAEGTGVKEKSKLLKELVEIEKGRSVPMGSPIDHSIQYGCGMAKVSCMNDLYLNNK